MKFAIVGHSMGAHIAARAAALIPQTRVLGCVCFTPGGLKVPQSFKNSLKPEITDTELFNTQKCRGIIETAGPEIGDHFYQFKLQMLGNGPQKFLRRWRMMATCWTWEDDADAFIRAQKALGERLVIVFADDDHKIDNEGSKALLEPEVDKFVIKVEEGTHDLPMLRPTRCAGIVEEVVGVKKEEKTVE